MQELSAAQFTIKACTLLLTSLAGLILTAQEPLLTGKLVDLTHAFNAETIYWPDLCVTSRPHPKIKRI